MSAGARRRSGRLGRLALTLVAAAITGCTSGGDRTGEPSTLATTSAVASTAGATTIVASTVPGATTAPQPAPDNPDCEAGPGRTVTELPDAIIAPIVVDEVDLPAQEVGGLRMPAVHIEGVNIPARTIDGGCIVEFDAPGGCLGALEVSAVEVPGVRLPGYEIEAVEDHGQVVAEGIVRPPVVIDDAAAPSVRLEQDCEIVTTGDRTALVRQALVRRAAIREGGAREGARRPPLCTDEQCSAALEVDAVTVPQASVSEVVIPELVVQVQQLTGAAQVIEIPGKTSFTAPVDVFFDVEAAVLRPDATPSLEAIAAGIGLAPAGSPVSVEGHTDSDGDDAYNDDLSQRRARAVADWLVANAAVSADRITTIGHGERVPVAANETPQGKTANRRVVISVVQE